MGAAARAAPPSGARSVILGTAGHIDHGKTTLIRALTGVDTDRLPEEKRRGITIELGFAPLELDGIGTVGIVDVPGHEAFVRTMLAGATGIDVALVVVAGDEGIMPQTREHLAILDLLGVSAGIVAITKVDLAEPDWLQLVEDDVRSAIAAGSIRDAAIVRCSATTGQGMEELRTAIARAALRIPARRADEAFRMPIDRAFSVKGTGTVVTGTVWSGSVALDDAVRILPDDRPARVRRIESHGHRHGAAASGTRTAVALGGVDRADISPRGSVLVRAGDAWVARAVLRADVSLLDGAPILGPRTRVRFHLGTADVGARLVATGAPVAAGSVVPVRVMLDERVIARAGDRFVIRAASPPATIGGGVVTDSDPPRRRAKPWPSAGADAGLRLRWILAEAGGRGVAIAALDIRLGTPGGEIRSLAQAGGAVLVGEHLFDGALVPGLAAACARAVDEAHRQRPLDPGVPVQTIRSATTAAPALVDHVLATMVAAGSITIADGIVARAGWSPGASHADSERMELVLAALVAAGRQPPAIDELSTSFGADTLAVLKLLARRGDVVAVAGDRYFAAGAAQELVAVIRSELADGAIRSASELRVATGLTRKYIIPFLEYCDRIGVTVRDGDGRTLGRGEPLRPD